MYLYGTSDSEDKKFSAKTKIFLYQVYQEKLYKSKRFFFFNLNVDKNSLKMLTTTAYK